MTYEKTKEALQILKEKISALKMTIDVPPTTKEKKEAAIAYNISGAGIGMFEGSDSGEDVLGLIIYTRNKTLYEKLNADGYIKRLLGKEGYPDIVYEIEEIDNITIECLSEKKRPVECGYSVGHCYGLGGTIGCLVTKKKDNKKYILSNSHVLAKSGDATRGDVILQPCHYDGGKISSDAIALLADWVPFTFEPFYSNKVDAAIAGPITSLDCSPVIAIIDQIPKGVNDNIIPGMRVHKVGQKTGHTWGVVHSIKNFHSIPYKMLSDYYMQVGFDGLVFCSKYSAVGDSGSLVLDENNYAVGLHIGCAKNKYSIFCKIKPVLESLGVELVIDKG
ncbi:MAG: S1 family peptidase [Nanoarchaeota archaeon]|nr:S1 family peptidase [Nanoarchaeota archaeon]